MEDESNSTSTLSIDSTFSNQFSSKETDKEFDELSEGKNPNARICITVLDARLIVLYREENGHYP